MSNSLHFYNHPQDQRSPVAVIKLKDQNTAYHIQTFLTGDVQTEGSCSEWINRITDAKSDPDYLYEDFINCCATKLTHLQMSVENEYLELDTPPREMKLNDMQIILRKWREYLQTSQEVEYSWSEEG
jgi:hypothetical protein